MLQPIELLKKELAELMAIDSETQFTKKARADELIPAYENSIKFLEAVNGVNASHHQALHKHLVVGSFFNRLSHIGKKYYYGRRVQWLLEDKKGTGVYCDKCGNIANGIEEGRVLGLRYRIPLCKSHLSD